MMEQAELQRIVEAISEKLGAPTEICMDDGRHVQSWGQSSPRWGIFPFIVVGLPTLLIIILFFYFTFFVGV